MSAMLDLTVEAEARDRALAALAGTTVRRPTLCLLKGRVGNEANDRWGWAIYPRKAIWRFRIASLLSGHRLLFNLGGLSIAIPQFQFLHELPGNKLAVREGRLVLLPRSGRA